MTSGSPSDPECGAGSPGGAGSFRSTRLVSFRLEAIWTRFRFFIRNPVLTRWGALLRSGSDCSWKAEARRFEASEAGIADVSVRIRSGGSRHCCRDGVVRLLLISAVRCVSWGVSRRSAGLSTADAGDARRRDRQPIDFRGDRNAVDVFAQWKAGGSTTSGENRCRFDLAESCAAAA